MGIGEWRPAAPGLNITWLHPRLPVDRLVIPRAVYEEREASLLSKWDAMKGYLASGSCRSQFLDRYFGTSEDQGACGTCDRCQCDGWDAEQWARKHIPESGIDGHTLLRLLPPLLRDCAMESLRSLRQEGVLTSEGKQVFIRN
jgi:hypothetical protein